MADLLESVCAAMENYFGDDRRRIDHAHRVADFARQLVSSVDADETVALAAAYLHDIGIHEAERRHGSSSGQYQEIEGPPIARKILEELGVEDDLVQTVCTLIGKHHTPNGVDSSEFRVLWDSDALVNLEEVLPGKGPDQVSAILRKSFVTEEGLRVARKIYLDEGDH